jgi:hypothetical protein
MRTLSALLHYALAIVTLACGLAAGAWWLIASGPLQARADKPPAPIPPRIAESLERKAAREPERPKEPARPAMQQANVSLAVQQPAPQFRIRELARSPQIAQRKKSSRDQKDQKKERAPITPAAIEAGSAPAVTTARTDFPY